MNRLKRDFIIIVVASVALLFLCVALAKGQNIPLPANAQTECGLNGARVTLNKSVAYVPNDPATWAARWGPCMGRSTADCNDSASSNCGNQRRCISTENNGQKYNEYIAWAHLPYSSQDVNDWGIVCGLENTLWNQCKAGGGCGGAPTNPCPIPGQTCQGPCPSVCPAGQSCQGPCVQKCTPNPLPQIIVDTLNQARGWTIIGSGRRAALTKAYIAAAAYKPCVESTAKLEMVLSDEVSP